MSLARSCAALVVSLSVACGKPLRDRPRVRVEPDASVTLVARTPGLPTWPCMERCHRARTPDNRPRTLRELHTGKVLRHGATLTWCDRCHDPADLDRLRLFDGATAALDEAPRLCGQCHAEKHADWTRGVHGIQTGSWRDGRLRRSCTACHDPHDPHRPRFEAMPRPLLRPGEQRSESP